MTLDQWMDSVDAPNFAPRIACQNIKGAVYVPDCRAIEHMRTYLFGLSDYVVSNVTGGSLVLIPKVTATE